MAHTLRIRRDNRPDTVIAIPDGSSVTIAPNGDVDVSVGACVMPTDYDAVARIRSGPVSRYTVSAWTTGHGKPPAVGGCADIFTNIHDVDPTDPELRPMVVGALVTSVTDPNPKTTRNRRVEIELELTQAEIDRIQLHEHRNSFTFSPVVCPDRLDGG